MTGLKLARLPDRTPVRVAISVVPDLQKALADYAAIYQQTYGEEQSIADLIPHMLAAFFGERSRVCQGARRAYGMAEMTGKTATDLPPERLLRLVEVRSRVGLGKTSIYEMVAQGRFPKPFRITSAAVRWSEREIDAWIAGVLEDDRAK